MSFSKAPLKRFNDPSGTYGAQTWGPRSGLALKALTLLGSLDLILRQINE